MLQGRTGRRLLLSHAEKILILQHLTHTERFIILPSGINGISKVILQWGAKVSTGISISANSSSSPQTATFATSFVGLPIVVATNDVAGLYTTFTDIEQDKFKFRYNTTGAKSNISCSARYVAIGY